MINNKNMGWNFDNSYLNLPETFYSKVNLNSIGSPQLVVFNDNLAKMLGLNVEELKTNYGISILAANKKASGGAYIAQAYAGHQFGHFTMLGDGRALLIGEQITPTNDRYDIQLKGSGKTIYSRGGDGKAVLGPMLREYIISEAMNGLGIPTTRSLSVVKTGEVVYRQKEEEGAILTRVASSHIRFGTFEYAHNFGDAEMVKLLADYTIDRHYPYIKEDDNKYLGLLKEVIKAQASLVAKWQSIGFIHGVLNTDNMSISGESIDYGPCAYMDIYNPDTVFSSIDAEGRYSYKNQPIMVNWNLCRFAETLLPLLHENKEKSLELAQEAINSFFNIYSENWLSIMRGKLGIFDKDDLDIKIIEELFSLMEKFKEDYTNTFLSLTFDKNKYSDMFKSKEFSNWNEIWKLRLSRQPQSKEMILKLMKNSNPAVIPRNHRVEEALEAANNGDYSVMHKLVDAISKPYEHSNIQEEYTKLPAPSSCQYKTYCGT